MTKFITTKRLPVVVWLSSGSASAQTSILMGMYRLPQGCAIVNKGFTIRPSLIPEIIENVGDCKNYVVIGGRAFPYDIRAWDRIDGASSLRRAIERRSDPKNYPTEVREVNVPIELEKHVVQHECMMNFQRTPDKCPTCGQEMKKAYDFGFLPVC